MQRSVSVIIPVRNEPDTIGSAIESVQAQTYGAIIEIIVADGMSTDNTRAVIEAIDDSRIRIVDNLATTTPAGLNAAIREASGDVIVRCDAHSVLPVDYVAVATRILSETGAVNVGGVQRATGNGAIQTGIAMAMSSRLGVGDAKFRYGGEPGPTDTVYLGVFDRAALIEAGPFDETLIRNQDYELNIRLRQAGGVVYFDPILSVEYRPRASLRALSTQYFQYGAWKRVVHRRHPDSIKFRQLAAPLLVLGLLASAGLAFTTQPWLGWLLPLAYLLTLVAAGLWSVIRTRQVASLIMPAAIALMHLSWGLGYLTGSMPGKPANSA